MLHSSSTKSLLGQDSITVPRLGSPPNSFYPLFDNGSLDSVNVVVDVNAIAHRSLVVVLHHQVLIEKAEGLFRRRRGKADQMGIEIFQHLAPEIVDRTVALVG